MKRHYHIVSNQQMMSGSSATSVTEIKLLNFTGTHVDTYVNNEGSLIAYCDVTLLEDITLTSFVSKKPHIYKAGTEFDYFNMHISHEIVGGNLRVTITYDGINHR